MEFGFGVAQANIADFDTTGLGTAYQDWGYAGTPPAGLQYEGVIGAWHASTVSERASVAQWLNDHYSPQREFVIVGNEIGYDFPEAPTQYASQFRRWYRTVHTANDNYKIGWGALLSAKPIAGTTGIKYWTDAYNELVRLNAINPPAIFPDFVAIHGYTPVDGWNNVDAFKKNIDTYYQWLKARGWEKLPLHMTEFSPLYPTAQSSNDIIAYMKATVSWLKADKRVDRALWFALNDGKLNLGHCKNLYLLDDKGDKTPQGKEWQTLIH